MATASETAKKTIDSLHAEFSGFTALPILSELYLDKAKNLDRQVRALVELHPRWSAEEGTILPFPVDGDWFEWEENPLFSIHELTEDLLWTWNKMQASGPTIESLIFFQRFSASLYALVGKAEKL